ncbi:uncharacterized protein LOC127877060 [Dreissena polymorpha]|uniref:uncharacterized protein LOC127877060 n=1 Tax=Dreissena polymorpha TaxID=45954 RepID=UPI0022645BB1|nr:uncharacterized protein LOC127877060 [Dreissena polymorpha]
MVKSAKDIQAVVKFAHAHNLHVTVRSSGHDYMGRSTWEGSFLINLSEMNEMEIDLNSSRSQYGTVKVQTGLQWQEIYQKLNAVSRVVVGGSAHTVTPGGYTLGGGHSPVSRSLGYAVDNLLEVQIVFADGSIATCTESRTVIKTYDGNFQYVENGDLFWALRGGGHSFGVVVYFLFRLHPMPKGMVTFASTIAIDIPAFGINYFNATMLLLRDLIVTMPTQWGGYWMINNGPGTFPVGESVIQYRGLLSLYFNKFGAWDGTEKAVFKSFTDWATAANVPFTFANKSDFWDFEKDAADPPITRAYLANSLLQPELLTEEFLSFMHSGLFLTSEYLGCTGVTLAGKTTNEPSGGTPLHPGYRSTITSLSCGIVLNDADKDLLDQPNKDQERIEGFWPFAEGLRKYGRGMYVNEAWKDNPYWREDFWGSNYDRLLSVKLRFDPKNFFTCHHCVGSEHLPGPKDGTSVAARMAAPWLLVVLVMGLIR